MSQYYLGFFQNDYGSSISLVLTTTELQPVNYSVYVRSTGNHYNGIVTANNSTVVNLPSSSIVTSYSHRYYGIYLETSSNKVTVIGQSYSSHTTDTYLALPTIKTKTVAEYIYYVMSVQSVNSYSSFLIVGTEDNTVLKLKFPSYYRFYAYSPNGYSRIYSYREYSYTINRLETMYIYPRSSYNYDLSGTRIIANKPVSVFSGHQCAHVPYAHGNCGYLIEQIPPTMFWGKIYYIAPLATRRSYTIKVLAAYSGTTVIIYCNGTTYSSSLNEQSHTTRTLSNQEYCAVHSNNKVLVAQFSGHNGEDPSMVLVTANSNFASKFQFSTFHHKTTPFYYPVPSFVNIIVMAQNYQSDMIYLTTTGGKMSLSTQEWVPIKVKGIIEAYATKVAILSSIVEVTHTTNITALMSVVVYGISARNGYIHPGGPFYNMIGKLLLYSSYYCKLLLFSIYYVIICRLTHSCIMILELLNYIAMYVIICYLCINHDQFKPTIAPIASSNHVYVVANFKSTHLLFTTDQVEG